MVQKGDKVMNPIECVDITLHCDNVHKAFEEQRVLGDITLKIARGQFVSIIGGSGCGKSTLLNMIHGTFKPTQGRILINKDGVETEIDGHSRERGMVFQHYSIPPHLTAIKNVALGPMLSETSIPGRMLGRVTRSWPRLSREHLQKAEEWLVRFGLKDALHKYPHKLSGGMKQRVAIARELIMEPEILLLDEPFGALDEEKRTDAQEILLSLYEENMQAITRGEKPPYTIIFVTHSLQEAVLVGDRVIGISRNWDWQSEGFDRHPGASVVYDKVAPIYSKDTPIDSHQIELQAKELRGVVLKGSNISRQTYCTFWDEVHNGRGRGVMSGHGERDE
jgi:NitT/TauT family transport system ATP-binding protein